MKILLLKASSDYWYKIVEVNSIDQLYNLSKGHGIILQRNYHANEDFTNEYWDGMTEEDAITIRTIKYIAEIYDDYVE